MRVCPQVIILAAGVVLAYCLVGLGACSMNIPNVLFLAPDSTAFVVFMTILFGTAGAAFIGFVWYAKKRVGIEF